MLSTNKVFPSIWDYQYSLFLLWFLVFTLICFGTIICWNEGVLSTLIITDKSRLSFAIAFIFFIGLAHCAVRSVFISSQLNITSIVINNANCNKKPIVFGNDLIQIGKEEIPENSLFGIYLSGLINISDSSISATESLNRSNIVDILIARTKGPHDVGWFLVDVLLKLGLMGTIVGFVLMLGSVTNAETLSADTMQNILKQMGSGMGTALFTTLTGLTCSLLLGVQYLLLDKGADELIERILEFSDARLDC